MEFIIPGTTTSFPSPQAAKHPHSMMLLPPCLTVGMRFFPQKLFLVYTKHSTYPYDQTVLFLSSLTTTRCSQYLNGLSTLSFANWGWALWCFALSRGFFLATLPWNPALFSVHCIVVWCTSTLALYKLSCTSVEVTPWFSFTCLTSCLTVQSKIFFGQPVQGRE